MHDLLMFFYTSCHSSLANFNLITDLNLLNELDFSEKNEKYLYTCVLLFYAANSLSLSDKV